MKTVDVTPFHAAAIMRHSLALARAGRRIIPMHFGQPTLGAPRAALAAAQRELAANSLGYFESMPLRERLARHYAETYGVEVAPRRILLTPGASGALLAAFVALFPGRQRLAVTRPGYPAYRNTLAALGHEVIEIRCAVEDGFRPSPAAVAQATEGAAGFVLASPANPTGAMLGRAALAAIAAACRANGVQLISDEIYHGISYGSRAVCALEVEPQAIVINSFSKLYRMPGWRLGWMVVPEELADPIARIVENLFLTAPTLAQHAALVALGEREDLARAVEIYARNRRLLLEALPEIGIERFAAPEGAFYLYADVAHLTRDSLAFCLQLIEDTGIGFAPGIDFDTLEGGHFVRLSFAVNTAEVEQAIGLLGPWLRSRGAR